jgi:uncharacterized protein (UPF0332 family)
MPYDELLRQRRLRPYQPRPREITRLLQVAARDLATAEKVLPDDRDWAFSIAYNAILQAARALMLYKGYRARGPDQHRTAVRFCELTFDASRRHQLALFDQMRRKRHRLVYEVAGLVSQQEAEQALTFARFFVEEIRLLISGQPRLELSDK